MDGTLGAWHKLGTVSPAGLADTRIQLHWAAQVVAMAGVALHEPRPDTSHSNLGWLSGTGLAGTGLAGAGLLAGRPILRPAVRLALRPDDPALVLLPGDATGELARIAVAGTTLDELVAWAEATLAGATGAALPHGLTRPGYDLPAHPVAEGAAFAPDPAAAAELGRWFACAASALGRVAAAHPGASEVRCWPHHFDLATLIPVEGGGGGGDGGGGGEDARSIGVGLSPGDGGYAEPYWYVTPWPYPAADAALPELPAGHWHREGWTGAVLTGTETVAAGGGEQQAGLVGAFLDAAIAGCRASLGV